MNEELTRLIAIFKSLLTLQGDLIAMRWINLNFVSVIMINAFFTTHIVFENNTKISVPECRRAQHD